MKLQIGPFEDRQSPVFCICKHLNQEAFTDIEEEFAPDLSGNSFMQIGTLAIIAMACSKARHLGKEVKGRYNPDSSLSNYMKRMNFFSIQDIKKQESFHRHSSGDRFLEITKVSSETNTNEIPTKLRSIVSRQPGVHQSLIDALDYSFGEVIDNVENHACSDVDGYVAAQYYPKENYVEFCVVDGGIGIARSLKKNESYRHLSGEELLLRAFDEGVGEQVGNASLGSLGDGCGLGLTLTARLVEATKGSLWVVSHEYAAKITAAGRESVEGMYYPGTAICARVPAYAMIKIKYSDLFSDGNGELYSWSANDLSNPDVSISNDILW